ncbi:MAG: hypothetical protein NHB32_17830 [Fischerella sp. CENA71]|nr:hypothetical protein [Fischerella sp. CENA71]
MVKQLIFETPRHQDTKKTTLHHQKASPKLKQIKQSAEADFSYETVILIAGGFLNIREVLYSPRLRMHRLIPIQKMFATHS